MDFNRDLYTLQYRLEKSADLSTFRKNGIPPWKLNVGPEKLPSQKESKSSNHHFSGAMLKLSGCN